MPTVSVDLSVTEYKRVNFGFNPIVLQALRDTVRIVFADDKPALGNTTFHVLNGGDAPMHMQYLDTNVWVLAMTDTSSLIATEATNATTPPQRDDAFKTAFNTIFGDAVTDSRVDDVSINFHYGASLKHDIRDLSSGTGSYSEIGSDVRVSCGTGVGTGYIESQNAIRYRAGHEAYAFFTLDINANEAGVNSYIGPLNEEDAVAFGYQGTTFGIWYIEGGNTDFISQSSWNVDAADWLDPSQRNLCFITYGYLGIAPIVFRMYGGKDRGWVVVHVIDVVNQQAEGHLKNPTLPIGMKVERLSGSGTDISITTGSWNAGSVGGGNVADRWVTVSNVISGIPSKTGDNWYNLFTLRNKSVFNGKANHVRVELGIINFTTDANKSVEFANIVNGTLTGNTAFADVDAGESVLEVSYDGNVEGIPAGASTVLTKVSDRRTDVRGTDLYIYAGGADVSTGCRGVGGASVTGDVTATFRLVQEF